MECADTRSTSLRFRHKIRILIVFIPTIKKQLAFYKGFFIEKLRQGRLQLAVITQKLIDKRIRCLLNLATIARRHKIITT